MRVLPPTWNDSSPRVRFTIGLRAYAADIVRADADRIPGTGRRWQDWWELLQRQAEVFPGLTPPSFPRFSRQLLIGRSPVLSPVVFPIIRWSRSIVMILLVEDDGALRELAVIMLQDAGYQVVEAKDAETALEIVQSSKPRIDLLLTDVIMPGKTGVELREHMQTIYPNLRSLFMSGYAGDLIALRGGVMPEAAFLEKPFTRSALLMKVYSALHSDPAKLQPQADQLDPYPAQSRTG